MCNPTQISTIFATRKLVGQYTSLLLQRLGAYFLWSSLKMVLSLIAFIPFCTDCNLYWNYC